MQNTMGEGADKMHNTYIPFPFLDWLINLVCCVGTGEGIPEAGQGEVPRARGGGRRQQPRYRGQLCRDRRPHHRRRSAGQAATWSNGQPNGNGCGGIRVDAEAGVQGPADGAHCILQTRNLY